MKLRLAVLLAALAGALLATAPGGSAAKPCARVAKAVHHHKVVRCARIRRVAAARRTAAERLVPFALPAPVAPKAPVAPPPAPEPPPRYVSVTAREFTFTLSRPVVGAGEVTVELRNRGEDPHNLVISPDDGSHAPLATWADTDPKGVSAQKVPLAPGDYRLWCSLLDHESLGMSARLQVR